MVEMIPNIESKAAKLLGRERLQCWGGKPKSAGKHGLGDKDPPTGLISDDHTCSLNVLAPILTEVERGSGS
jgi:hypothetical protein